jgi:hypothetical protein
LLALLLIPRRALRRPLAFAMLGVVICIAWIAFGVWWQG